MKAFSPRFYQNIRQVNTEALMSSSLQCHCSQKSNQVQIFRQKNNIVLYFNDC